MNPDARSGRCKQPDSEVKVLAPQSCPTLCDPKDCSLPGSSVHGVLQTRILESESESRSVMSETLFDPTDYTVHGILRARILEWIALPIFRGSSQPRDRTQASHIAVDSLPPAELSGKPPGVGSGSKSAGLIEAERTATSEKKGEVDRWRLEFSCSFPFQPQQAEHHSPNQ